MERRIASLHIQLIRELIHNAFNGLRNDVLSKVSFKLHPETFTRACHDDL